MQRIHIKHFAVGICLLFTGIFCKFSVNADVLEGTPGQTLTGEYAVIVNTDTSTSQNTGTLIFDDGSDAASVTSSAGTSPVEPSTVPTSTEASSIISQSTSLLSDNNFSTDNKFSLYTSSSLSAQTAVTTYRTGEEKFIYGPNSSGKTYACIGIGEHCYVWMDKTMKSDYDSAGKTDLIAKDIAAVYDGQPYRILNELAGGSIPCEDNSGKLSILLESLNSASGMYMYDTGITAIHINTPTAASYVSGEMSRRNGLLVHEGQHALLWLKTNFSGSGRYMWLNEGLSVAAMDYLWGGTDSSGWLNGISGNSTIRNGASLIYQTYRNDTAQDYGIPYLFVRYVIDRMAESYDPMKILPQFYTISASGLSCEEYLQKVTGVPFHELMADFYTAIAAGDLTGKYSFAGDRIAARKAATFPVFSGSSGQSYTLPPASAIIIKLKDGQFSVPSNGDKNILYRVTGARTASVSPSEGNGTASNPYKITSLNDLNLISEHPGAYYELTTDIQTNGRINFTVNDFSGHLNGNEHTIYGLKKPLIAQNHGTVEGLYIVADFDDDSQNVQGIFAQYNDGKILDCSVTGTVTGHMGGNGSMAFPEFGGIAGQNEPAGIISGCSSKLNLTLTMPPMKSIVGGIVGLNTGSVEKCISNGILTVIQKNGDSSPLYVGGIVGEIQKFGNMGGTVKECLHAGQINVSGGNSSIGQICGIAAANVLNSSAGLNGHILNCYGKAAGTPLVGSSTETITTGGLLTDAQLKDTSSYKGWSFDGDWKLSEDGIPARTTSSDITSLSVKNNPDTCCLGEIPWNFGTLVINGKTEISISQDMVHGFDSSTEGIKTVSVTYKGNQVSFPVQVIKPEKSQITQMDFSRRPNRITYSEGEKFDPSGTSFYAVINGRYVYIYSGYTFDKTGYLTPADTKIIFDYCGISFEQPITVTAATPSGLEILSEPSKTRYTTGERLELSGLKLRLTYSNGKRSPIFGADELAAYGINLALGDGNSIYAIDRQKTLDLSDSGKDLLFYATKTLPGNSGAVYAVSSALTVSAPLMISNTELYLASGTKHTQYINSGEVTGGSGTYSTTVVSENLPQGLSRDFVPGISSSFSYSGIITAPSGTYRSTYLVRDTVTQASLSVTITIHVRPSNEAVFYSFILRKAQNSHLTQDVIGEIGSDTVILRLPEGTDVTNLIPEIDYASGTGTTLPENFWNGTAHDFTRPVIYTLLAPDGHTQKNYTVKVEFYKNGQDTPVDPLPPEDDKPSAKPDEASKPAVTPTNTPSVPSLPAAYPKGKIIKDLKTNAVYKVTGTLIVQYVKPLNKKRSSIVIPDQVTLNRRDYKVTSIGAKAFKNNKYLKKITIGKNIKTIGSQTFYNCKKLKVLKFRTSQLRQKYIGSNAFKKMPSKITVYVSKKQVKYYKKIFLKRGISRSAKFRKI